MKLEDIKGLGEKRIKKLESVGIFKPEDLILHFPYKYLDLSQKLDFMALNDGEEVSFLGKVASIPTQKYIRKGLSFVKVKFETNGEIIECTWFNQPYVARQLIMDKLFFCYGKVKKFNKKIDISAPVITAYKSTDQNIIPLYKSIKGLPVNVLTEAIKQILTDIKIVGYLDNAVCEKFNLLPLDKSIRELHNPTSIFDAEKAGKSITIENTCYSLCLFNILKKRNIGNRQFIYNNNRSKIDGLISKLPYKLTDDQNMAVNEIIDALSKPNSMNRLLQGDVGCGKTIVAFIIMYYAFLSGYQSVLMSPTEILARQHYVNAINLFEMAGIQINIEYLSGSQNARLRDNSLFNIKNGVANIIIGTHSVISDSVTFSNLSLVITDEQHRFGVAQRGSLENKSAGSDTLVMSATPIPRTLALTLYGDLEQTIIKSMPKNKAKTETKFVSEHKIQDMFDFIAKNALENRQTYIVCPRIENDDDDSLYSAEELYKNIKSKFQSVGIGLLHGQMKEIEKSEIMNAFTKGEIKVLVATTVIEVGIDVKNATNIVIFNAERFGLSQLHQLRGRVGRGDKDSFCFLIIGKNQESAKERLQHFANCSDGFSLAEYDFEIRGAGDFLGKRQHGQSSSNGGVKITPEILKQSKEVADYLLNIPSIFEEISKKSEIGENDYIKSLTLN